MNTFKFPGKFPGWPWIGEGIRIAAPIPLTLSAVGLVLILWRGGWPIETAEARVQWLGIALLANIFMIGLALFLTKDGISSFSLKAGAVEVNVNEDEHEKNQ
ncbi:hypothetical protein [Candidatus Phycosocius spiralis]|uniref:Uncharacterized protein n=1 Tax=Candidatus Phycosocius spiralis TaxID=2815099 RepID=A0ABQ4PVZ3_9PROT|nr:hypothetical protein [Candidatus Phycosocius spiralis]GIU67159.1 hypothetical protein PsB1_1313 [Candidatus Phycosocius spiralis]